MFAVKILLKFYHLFLQPKQIVIWISESHSTKRSTNVLKVPWNSVHLLTWIWIMWMEWWSWGCWRWQILIWRFCREKNNNKLWISVLSRWVNLWLVHWEFEFFANLEYWLLPLSTQNCNRHSMFRYYHISE